MAAHHDNSRLDQVKTHFIGEPGTTGREPFSDSIPSGPGDNFASQGGVGGHSGPGLTSGQHSHAHGDHSSGLSGQHPSSAVHTGGVGSHTHGDHSSSSGGLTGASRHNDASTGVLGSGQHGQHQHNSQTGAGAGPAAGAVGISGGGLDGLSHQNERSAGNATGHLASSSNNHPSAHSSSHNNDNRGVVEKVKDALPGGNSSSHSTSNTSHSNTHSSTGVAGTHHNSNTTDYHPSSNATGAGGQHDVVDKINDTLPGTPAKTHQNYGTSHNPATQGDHSLGGRNEYGAGQHGTSGLTGAGAGAGVGAGAAGLGHGDHHNTGSNTHSSTHNNDNRGVVDKVKDALPGGNSSSHSNAHSSTTGAHSSTTGTHSNTAGGLTGTGSSHSPIDNVHHDTSQRAPGKSSGGIGGILATSDKDFTGRERQGQGAYEDSQGLYKDNTSGPKGNSALTGREGDLGNNPVAQAQSRDTGSSTTAPHNVHAEEGHGEKKGLLAKIKDAIS